MLYSTSPSSSSAASSSGRSSPEAQPHDGGSGSGRSATTTASSFLPPFFMSSKQPLAPQLQQPLRTPSSLDSAAPPPRRTSFGTALGPGGKLSALSALGFFPTSSTLSTSPPSSSASSLVKPEFGPRSASSPAAKGAASELGSAGSSSSPQPSKAAPPRRHMCFPDGMGGTMCVEIRDRDRRGSS
ncbi:uncharacterized protein PFL1_00452 [Pseudozyma flocculosa PF-1]|uniref:uncharacterized protein n=1 Tax=Pseudozyma flocculosa PF-1 TaxID=1277687 RepID=UPI00045602A4|nr:uncharacterized protein PFL1_00452 [Pseudozyma flocculosa PF-1]EPQ32255.1 hypothetical protein PFL1_00452 [Pseudozyma flocculosa PF-1]